VPNSRTIGLEPDNAFSEDASGVMKDLIVGLNKSPDVRAGSAGVLACPRRIQLSGDNQHDA
jgi:hypothetical protein